MISGSGKFCPYAERISRGSLNFGSLMKMPCEERATSMSWIIVEMMNWIACRMVFAADRLIPTLRWSQITSTQTILMINSVEIKTSRILLAESGRWFFFHTLWGIWCLRLFRNGTWGCWMLPLWRMSMLITLLVLPMSLCRNLLAWVFNTCNNNLALFAVWTGAYDRGHFRWGSDVNGKGWCLIEYQDIFYVINYSNLVIKTIGRDLSTGQTAEHT